MISIIVPVYNTEKYLEKCVSSLLNQTYNDLEIILINDKSTDGSKEICEKYKLLDKRIKVVHKKNNEGLGHARNTGLKEANGEYVLFIDSDDFVENTQVENLYTDLKRNKADTCIGGFKKVTDGGKVIFEKEYSEIIYRDKDCVNKLIPRMIGSVPQKSDSVRPQVWNVLFSMDIIKKYKLEFVSEREYCSEDLMFDFIYYKHTNCVVFSSSTNYCYRSNPDSLTMKYNKNKFNLQTKMYLTTLKEISNFNYKDSQIINRTQKSYLIALRSCIRQENREISKLKWKQTKRNLYELCTHEEVKNVLNSFPINQLEVKQRIFCYMLKNKNILGLYAGIKLNLI